jgi:hypothetical protein
MLQDWVSYQQREGEPYPRVLYTNIPLNVDNINSYLSNEFGTEIDISEQIEVLEDSFFCNEKGEYIEWWSKFGDNDFVVIDEVHHYLPSSLKRKKGGLELADHFMNYVLKHRHQGQDIIFLTQHLNNIAIEIKRMASVIYEVLNIKNMTVGIWPFKIPMEDIDIVRESWGYPVQLAHVKRGVCAANSVTYDRQHEVFVLTPSLFGLYESHTNSSVSLDRPSLKLGRFGSLVWFSKKYVPKFIIYAVILVTLFFMGKTFITHLPTVLSKSLVPPSSSSKSPVDTPQTSTPISTPSALPVPSSLAPASPTLAPPEDDTILGFLPGRVITKKGTLSLNDHIIVDGEKDYVKQVDVTRGILYLGSGKKIQK